MRTNIEWDILSVYPYNEENIQELICRLYTMVEDLKANGQVIDPNLITKINTMIEQLKRKQISIDMFGAVGDGIKDDTTAIQTAIEYCYNNNIPELYIPAGKFKVSRGITTYNVKLTGLSKPYAPNPIGFEYAFPETHRPDLRAKWLGMCGGSIIESTFNGHIFLDGLIAENLMVFGDVNQPAQCGVGQNDGGVNKQVILDNVTILCCGGHGVYAPYGLISPKIRNCRINSCMGNAIHIGKAKGTYTGETNNVTIEHNDLNRNGKESIYLDVLGRVYNISFNEMEHVGFVSHKIEEHKGQAPQRETDIVYCCKLLLSGGGGFGTGEVTFNNNYSESSYGLLRLYATGADFNNIANNINIAGNFWFARANDGYSCGIRIDGGVWRVTVWGNKLYSQRDIVVTGNTVKGITTDSPLRNEDTTNNNCIMISNLGDNPVNDIYNMGHYQIGKPAQTQITSVSHQASDPTFGDITQVFYSAHSLNNDTLGFEFVKDGTANITVGNILKFKGQPIGIVVNVSTHNHVIYVKGNKTELINKIKGNGNGEVQFERIGGIYQRNLQGQKIKTVIDGNTIYGITIGY